jgi:hypothetical protein
MSANFCLPEKPRVWSVLTSQGRKRDKNQKLILYRQEHLLRKYTITHTLKYQMKTKSGLANWLEAEQQRSSPRICADASVNFVLQNFCAVMVCLPHFVFTTSKKPT